MGNHQKKKKSVLHHAPAIKKIRKLTKAQKKAKYAQMLARMKRQEMIDLTRRKPPARGVVITPVPSGVTGHYYTGSEFLGKEHKTIHAAIAKKVMHDLAQNKAVSNVSATCAAALASAAVNQTNKHYIQHFVDAQGRTVTAIGRILPDPDPDRKAETPDPLGGIDTTRDDRGHLVPEKGVSAGAVQAANKQKNVVAENWLINQHYKKAFEDAVKSYAEAHPSSVVMTMHEPRYNGTEFRPYQIVHYILVDNKVVSVFTFANPNTIIEARSA